MFETITVAYDPAEDRIVMAVDLDQPQAAAFWLTRRLTLALLRQASSLLDQTSPLTAAASFHDRKTVAAIEREAALGATRSALQPTGEEPLHRGKARAERAERIDVTAAGESVRLTVIGVGGHQTQGDLSRALFQQILDLLAKEAINADWTAAAAAPVDGEATAPPASVSRH